MGHPVYSTYVRPHLDYATSVLMDTLLCTTKCDSKRYRACCETGHRSSIQDIDRKASARDYLGCGTLKTKWTIHKQLFFHRLTNTKNQPPRYMREILPELRFQNTGRTLRNSRTLTLPADKTTSFKRSFIPNATRTWNRLPEALRAQHSLSQFKKGIIDTFGTPNPPAYFSFGSKLGNSYHAQIRAGRAQ